MLERVAHGLRADGDLEGLFWPEGLLLLSTDGSLCVVVVVAVVAAMVVVAAVVVVVVSSLGRLNCTVSSGGAGGGPVWEDDAMHFGPSICNHPIRKNLHLGKVL